METNIKTKTIFEKFKAKRTQTETTGTEIAIPETLLNKAACIKKQKAGGSRFEPWHPLFEIYFIFEISLSNLIEHMKINIFHNLNFL